MTNKIYWPSKKDLLDFAALLVFFAGLICLMFLDYGVGL